MRNPRTVQDQFNAIVRAETHERVQHLLSVRVLYMVDSDLEQIFKNLWRNALSTG